MSSGALRFVRVLSAILAFMTVSFGVAGAEKLEGSLIPPPREVMATYLLHFARLTTFPAAKPLLIGTEGKPEFRVVIAGEDPFGKLLENVFDGELVGGRPVSVVRVATGTSLPECHMVFFGKLEPERHLSLVQELKGKAVLCLGEGSGFLEVGMVGFREEGGKVVFDVHQERILGVGLRLDSRLLRIARVVRRAQ